MTYRLELRKEKDVVYVRASGIRSRETVSSIAHEILDACDKHQVDRVLVNVQELTGRLSIFDSFMLVAEEFPKLKRRQILKKAALVDNRERRERFRFFELLAHNRGYNLRIFDDADEALEWIRGDESTA